MRSLFQDTVSKFIPLEFFPNDLVTSHQRYQLEDKVVMDVSLDKLVDFFAEADNKLIEEFSQKAVMQSFKKDTYLSMEGDSCKYFPIVKSGLIRVFKLGPRGQEITLYRIERGQSCILTISCLLAKHSFPALAVVEEDCEVILIPENILRDWMSRFSLWNQYIFDYLSKVLLNVLKILENISFKRTDTRIIEYLLTLSHQHGNTLNVTHQKIALDIGTAREVVSRALKNFENQKLIKLSRGKINILDMKKLESELALLQ